MKLSTKKEHCLMYVCNFCKTEIKASKKTEIYYRSSWIDGCNNCFALSINPETSKEFQAKDY